MIESIIENNKQRIYRICRAYAVHPEDRKDLFQEVVINIWQSLKGFREEAKIETWIYRIALNVCMRHSLKLKKKKKERSYSDLEIVVKGPDISQNLEQKESLEQLNRCIAALNEVEKSLITLFLEDLPYKSISQITGLSENNVAQKIKRIKEKLMHCIKEKYND